MKKAVGFLATLVSLFLFSIIASAEDPVNIPDINLKAAIEVELGKHFEQVDAIKPNIGERLRWRRIVNDFEIQLGVIAFRHRSNPFSSYSSKLERIAIATACARFIAPSFWHAALR